jgi:hypothetical protein
VSAAAGWLQDVRRLFAACARLARVIRNGAETVIREPYGQSERTEGAACEDPPHRLAGLVAVGPDDGP